MTIFAQLLKEVVEPNTPLSFTLLRARVLASELADPSFQEWVLAELNGYKCRLNDLPDYRRVAVANKGNFVGSHHVTGILLPLHHLDADLREVMASHGFRDGAGALEAFLKVEGTEVLWEPWDTRMMAYYRHKPGVTVQFCTLVEAYKEIPKHAIAGVLEAVRTRLLEFLLQLRRAHPDLSTSEAGLAAVKAAEVSHLVQRLIYNNCTFQEDHSVAKQHIQVGRDISVGGDFIVADAISTSFNKVAESGASPDIKGALKQLSAALAQLSPHLPEDKQKEAAQDFDTLATEAAKPVPRKKFIEMAAEGLKQTVSLAVAHAPAVIALVDAVLKHFGR